MTLLGSLSEGFNGWLNTDRESRECGHMQLRPRSIAVTKVCMYGDLLERDWYSHETLWWEYSCLDLDYCTELTPPWPRRRRILQRHPPSSGFIYWEDSMQRDNELKTHLNALQDQKGPTSPDLPHTAVPTKLPQYCQILRLHFWLLQSVDFFFHLNTHQNKINLLTIFNYLGSDAAICRIMTF